LGFNTILVLLERPLPSTVGQIQVLTFHSDNKGLIGIEDNDGTV
jgi:hypothetical protein